jgi:hypothetical protein
MVVSRNRLTIVDLFISRDFSLLLKILSFLKSHVFQQTILGRSSQIFSSIVFFPENSSLVSILTVEGLILR